MYRKHLLCFALTAALVAAPHVFAAERKLSQMDSAPVTAIADPALSGEAHFATRSGTAELLDLGLPDLNDLSALSDRRLAQAKNGQPLEIAMPRDVARPEVNLKGLAWEPLADGSLGARLHIVSPGAVALRAALEFASLAKGDDNQWSRNGIANGVILRFQGDGAQVFEFSSTYLSTRETNWSPAVDGEAMTIEIVLAPGLAPDKLALRIPQISHFDIAPASNHLTFADKIGESDYCERDMVCRSSPPTNFRSTGNAVARMLFTKSGSSYLCTGTLLNNSSSPKRQLFWTANHCIGTQTVANTLQTYWFYEATTCGGSTVSSAARTLTGGADLRHNNSTRDTSLLELKTAPPTGAVYAGWTSAAITSTGTAIEGIHHPAGDVKMYSLGSVTSTSTTLSGLGPFYRVQWSTGVTEGGSSGSGLFTITSTGGYQLRGGLYGGSSYCSTPTSPDYYSRFADVYSSISSYF
jgi:hypothetical protein